FGQAQRHGAPQPFAATGDQRDFALYSAVHSPNLSQPALETAKEIWRQAKARAYNLLLEPPRRP
ncbi:MAG TPA: hypothetical protein VKB24_07115, partial [Candidatus Acidoferrum sp.]|nr:hypothetical protein [Candidatus Acidoferrum sp.]